MTKETKHKSGDPHTEFLLVGEICASWALIELWLETIIWWELRIPEQFAQVITGSLDIERRARMARDLLGLQVSPQEDVEHLSAAIRFIEKIKDERNLVVHGTRTSDDENNTVLIITRGKWKYTPQPIHAERLRNLSAAIHYIIAWLKIFMVKHSIISNNGRNPLPPDLPLLLK